MEILQNTILKLVVRQGADADRKTIILDSGELGYTTDTYRLFVGDGFLSGGNVTGNLFKGSAPTITDVILWPSEIGDTAFASDTNKLYALQSGSGSLSANWLLIGGVYTSNTPYISISDDNKLTLNALSANSISLDAVSSPITINSGRITLTPLPANYISSDALSGNIILNDGRIMLSPLSANNVSSDAVTSPIVIDSGRVSLSPLSAYHVSSDALGEGLQITSGRISLSAIPIASVSTKTMTFGDGLNVTADGNPANGVAINPLSSNIVVESNQSYGLYYGLSGQTLVFNKNITGSTRLSAGHYRFDYTTYLPSPFYITMVQIAGIDALAYTPRVISQTVSSLDIKIYNDAGSSTDANIYFIVNY